MIETSGALTAGNISASMVQTAGSISTGNLTANAVSALGRKSLHFTHIAPSSKNPSFVPHLAH